MINARTGGGVRERRRLGCLYVACVKFNNEVILVCLTLLRGLFWCRKANVDLDWELLTIQIAELDRLNKPARRKLCVSDV